MAAVVWFTVGIALWHFTVFVPDRFWGGIVGALLGAIAGAMVTGAIAQIASGRHRADRTSSPPWSRSRAPCSGWRRSTPSGVQPRGSRLEPRAALAAAERPRA